MRSEDSSYDFSFNNPISKVDINLELNDSAYVSFVKIMQITKEIDRWKISYKVLNGDIVLKYDGATGKIDFDENYEVNDYAEKKFILYIFDESRQ